ncbi:RAN GTPase-activating protein 1 [Galdieria sulphuraria]|nr:RAN GTPase-activating protein 1 [Galdieria sulphuraria]
MNLSSGKVFCFDNYRERISEEKLEKIFSEYFQKVDKNEVVEVRLGGKSFDLEAAQLAAEILPTLVNLRVVSFADVIAGRKEEEGHGVLRVLSSSLESDQLYELDLSDNALGAKGIEACKKILRQQKKLQVIRFCNNGLAADAIQLLVSYLLEGGGPTSLKTIHFFNNLMESEGAKNVVPLLEFSPELEDLKLASLRVGEEGIEPVIRALKNTTLLRVLDLSDNILANRGANCLGRMFPLLSNLETLILRDTSLGDKGATTILQCLERSEIRLKVLDISCNELTAESCKNLAKLVEQQTCLERLLVEENDIGSKGVAMLAKALSSGAHSRLVELNLAENSIGTAGAKALFSVLIKLVSLRNVNLSGNWIKQVVVEELEDALSQINRTELTVSFSDNESEEEETEEYEEEDEDDISLNNSVDADVDATLETRNHSRNEDINALKDEFAKISVEKQADEK